MLGVGRCAAKERETYLDRVFTLSTRTTSRSLLPSNEPKVLELGVPRHGKNWTVNLCWKKGREAGSENERMQVRERDVSVPAYYVLLSEFFVMMMMGIGRTNV